MRGFITEYMFEHYPANILRDDMLEVFLGKGCSRAKGGLGGGLGKCLGHYDVCLSGFVMGYFSHIR